MKILVISKRDAGGGCHFIADALNRYTEHEAVSVRLREVYLKYKIDYSCPPKGTILKLIKWCDIIHARVLANNIMNPNLLQTNKKKIVTFTGRDYRWAPRKQFNRHRNNGYTVTCSTADLQLYLPEEEMPWLPNPRDVIEPTEKYDEFTVCHSPTSRKRKNTNAVIAACKQVGVKLELIEKVSYEECITRKARCHLLIDQFSMGYGNSGVEAWAMGMPVVGGTIEEKYKAHHESNYKGKLPYYDCNSGVDSIANAITLFRDNEDVYNEYKRRGVEYFFMYHHTPVVAKRLIEIYEGCK